MDAIWSLARAYKLFVVEDAAHATGARFGEAFLGAPSSHGESDAVAFSFYATKVLSTGEGGMLTSSSESLDRQMRILCLHGISKDAWNRYAEEGNWRYDVVACGFKYNLADIQSAIGIHQLRRQEEMWERRRRVVEAYNEAFSEMPELELPPDCLYGRHAWHLYVLRFRDRRLHRDEFISAMKRNRIGVSVHFIPIPLHSYFSSIASIQRHVYPRAMRLFERQISLPLFPGMTDDQIHRVIEAVKSSVFEFCGKKSLHVAVGGGVL
jgi:dTDP-4-amino-4,6-dideoxygalactose transaminase